MSKNKLCKLESDNIIFTDTRHNTANGIYRLIELSNVALTPLGNLLPPETPESVPVIGLSSDIETTHLVNIPFGEINWHFTPVQPQFASFVDGVSACSEAGHHHLGLSGRYDVYSWCSGH